MKAEALDLLTAASSRRGCVVAVTVLIAAAVVFSFSASSPVTGRLFFSAGGDEILSPRVSVGFAGDELKESSSVRSEESKALPLDLKELSNSHENSNATEVSINSTSATSLISGSEIFLNNQMNSSDGDLENLPKLQEELIVAGDENGENSSSDELAARPLDAKVTINFTSKTSLLSPTVNFSSNQVKSSDDDLRNLPKQQEVPVMSIAIVSPPLVDPASTGTSSKSEEHISLTEADRQLMYAKKEISHAPMVSDDPDLYAPLFRNISVFKRSYELMERILKIYIYRDGRRPIFHTPVLKGIYASEGWFMKQLGGNTQFVVKDPNKAHLFYLPYNSRQLEATLYKPGSHSLRPLAIFLKEYVDWISVKYPFWNRTRGADHFLVACHDWGPYETRLHTELSKNTIKALCNADLSEGFIRGKDVSLPETYIKNPKKPLKDLGGKPVSKRSILAFFAGQMHGRVRPVLLSHWQGKDEDMKIYGPLPSQIFKKFSYIQHMKSSKFCICPMGYEVNSPRIVEAIYYECVPVIIADNFILPFDEVLDWSVFSIVVAEKDIPNLKDILLKVSRRKYVSMHENVRRLKRHFLWHPVPVKYDIFHMILHSIWFNRLNQI